MQPQVITAQTPPTNEIAQAQHVLSHAAKALEQFSQNIGLSFTQALDIFDTIKGRVVVCGMGKSGHVGCKIAATLASTGTPSFFVHPAEANHGDLGMLTSQDCLLMLSNSGETEELANILRYAKRHTIPIVAITCNPTSTLGRQADVVLCLPSVGEACPLGLAPTTSTTVTMAIGDALAMALLTRRNLSLEEFNQFHPGGALGRKLLRVQDIMHERSKLPLAEVGTPMREALIIMTARSFGCLGITNNKGHLKGIITDGDLRRHMHAQLPDMKVEDVMTPHPRCIDGEELVAKALSIMNSNNITSLFVSTPKTGDNIIPIGMIHIHDCVRQGF